MVPPKRPELPSALSDIRFLITDDGSKSLYDEGLDETYHSGCGAISETFHVYVQNSGIADLLQQSKTDVRVLEYGFGTGTGFFLAAAFAKQNNSPFHYVGLENRLLPKAIFQGLDLGQCLRAMKPEYQLPDLAKEVEGLMIQWDNFRHGLLDLCPNGIYHFDFGDSIAMQLVIGDATEYKPDKGLFDAVFFDAFSPKTCPQLWSEAVLRNAMSGLRDNGTLVSYCVNARIQRILRELGMVVECIPGPPLGKREVLRSTKKVEC